jgi:hypothetical protein
MDEFDEEKVERKMGGLEANSQKQQRDRSSNSDGLLHDRRNN